MYLAFLVELSVIVDCPASSYLGRVVASDSKRGYLSSIVGSFLYLIRGSDRNL
jgi:hypothetical protein